ncbi:MAG: aminoacyl-tRNA hydrolase [Alphaproteobacteria bacterium]|nr:aminoacyl-tRNA hydrolase [Alphaproteobacteria bacterium]
MFILLVGLGNPGPEYALNRHNVGYMVVDDLAHTFQASSEKRQGKTLVREAKIGDTRVLLVKTLSYMNLSGPPVAELASFYKIPLDNVIVIHDELDLEFGRIRVKQGGGSGGHNGLKSLDSSLGQNYWRVRIGIGHPGDKSRVAGYVLQNFTKTEQEEVGDLLDDFSQEVTGLFLKDKSAFASKMATRRAVRTQKEK